jgi:hypothetical protein
MVSPEAMAVLRWFLRSPAKLRRLLELALTLGCGQKRRETTRNLMVDQKERIGRGKGSGTSSTFEL